jgi:hypothetical protein
MIDSAVGNKHTLSHKPEGLIDTLLTVIPEEVVMTALVELAAFFALAWPSEGLNI